MRQCQFFWCTVRGWRSYYFYCFIFFYYLLIKGVLLGIQFVVNHRNPAKNLSWPAAFPPKMYLLNSQDEYHLITVCSSLDKTFPWGSTFLSFGKPSQLVATITNDPPISPHCPVPCTNLYPNFFRWLSFFFNNQDRFGELYLSFPSLEWHELNMPEVNLIREEKGL